MLAEGAIEAAGYHARPRSRFLMTRSSCDGRHIIGSLFRVLVWPWRGSQGCCLLAVSLTG
jgi:hypothetical protein